MNERRASETFSVTQDDLRRILNGLPALIGYWDTELRNRLANDAYVEYFGQAPQEIRGKHIRDVLGPELYEKNRPYMEAALAGEPQLFDRAIPTPSGAVRHTQASYIPDVADGVVRGFFVLVTDITERRQAEQALAVAEARFRTLFASAPIGTYLADTGGRLIDVNPAGARLLGGTRDTLVGASIDELTHPEDRDVSRAQFLRLVSGEFDAYRLEKRYVRADGHVIWAQLDVTALRGDTDADLVVLAQVQDISERRRHDAQLIELAVRDELTGLLNRRGLQRELERHVAEGRRYGATGALLVIDLDNFKDINDTLGHQAGDDLLIEAGARMAQRLRGTDVLARLGGDEFAAILPHATVQQALDVARTLAGAVCVEAPLGADVAPAVTLSVGVAAFDAEAGADEMLARADRAMYDAKRTGKARISASG
jgi:diguanylate cyclase (GGDEF)-like protein/PAS domain S-box-containing protein